MVSVYQKKETKTVIITITTQYKIVIVIINLSKQQKTNKHIEQSLTKY